MEVITLESQVFKELVNKLDVITKYVQVHSDAEVEGWVDNSDVCRYLKISSRTLQRLRSQNLLAYSVIRGKAFYKLSEIQRMLNENLIKSHPRNFQELLDNYNKHTN